jgi:hypothetical protein
MAHRIDGGAAVPRPVTSWQGTLGLNKEIKNGNITTKVLVGGTAKVEQTKSSLGGSVQVAVTKIEVSGKSASGKSELSFGAEALTASAGAKLSWGNPFSAGSDYSRQVSGSKNTGSTSSSYSAKGIGISANAEAYIARTQVGGSTEILPGVSVKASAEVGIGAAAGGSAYLGSVGNSGKKVIDISGKLGLGATVGGGVKIEVDPAKFIGAVKSALDKIPQPWDIKPATPAPKPATSSYSPPPPRLATYTPYGPSVSEW